MSYQSGLSSASWHPWWGHQTSPEQLGRNPEDPGGGRRSFPFRHAETLVSMREWRAETVKHLVNYTDGSLPCQNYVGSTERHNPADWFYCPGEGNYRQLRSCQVAGEDVMKVKLCGVIPCSWHLSVLEGSPVQSHLPGLSSCYLHSYSSQRPEQDQLFPADVCTLTDPDANRNNLWVSQLCLTELSWSPGTDLCLTLQTFEMVTTLRQMEETVSRNTDWKMMQWARLANSGIWESS